MLRVGTHASAAFADAVRPASLAACAAIVVVACDRGALSAAIVGRARRTGACALGARLIGATGVTARAAVKRVVLGNADAIAHAAVIGPPIAIVVDAVAADFLVGELAAGAHLELGITCADAPPVVRVRALAVSLAQLGAQASGRVDPHAEARRAILALLAAIGELPHPRRPHAGDRRIVRRGARTEQHHQQGTCPGGRPSFLEPSS